MLALFLGTAALPHILIRYYTVRQPFSGEEIHHCGQLCYRPVLCPDAFHGPRRYDKRRYRSDKQQYVRALAGEKLRYDDLRIYLRRCVCHGSRNCQRTDRSSVGAVAHDLLDNFSKKKISDNKKVLAGKITAVIVGIIAMLLGIAFKNMNVSFLVGWAFAVAASANFPAIIMMLFWKKNDCKRYYRLCQCRACFRAGIDPALAGYL